MSEPNPIVTTAVTALRCFGGDLTYDLAELLLPLWAHYRELTLRERAEVLAAFGEPQLPFPIGNPGNFPIANPGNSGPGW